LPFQVPVEVVALYDEVLEELEAAYSGDNIRIRLKGVNDEDVSPGYVLSSAQAPVKTTTQFQAQLAILDSKVRSSRSLLLPILSLTLFFPFPSLFRTSSLLDTRRSCTFIPTRSFHLYSYFRSNADGLSMFLSLTARKSGLS